MSALTIELVETGLIDEGLIEVFNGLVEAGVVTPATRCLPSAYATYLQFGYADPDLYGFTFDVLRHDWSYYDHDPEAWAPSRFTPVGDRHEVWRGVAGRAAGSTPTYASRIPVPDGDGTVNALRLTGTLDLPGYGIFADSPTLNGPKIIPVALPPGPPRSRSATRWAAATRPSPADRRLRAPGGRAIGPRPRAWSSRSALSMLPP